MSFQTDAVSLLSDWLRSPSHILTIIDLKTLLSNHQNCTYMNFIWTWTRNKFPKNYSKTESKTELTKSLLASNRSNICLPRVWIMCLHNFSIRLIPRIESVDSFIQFWYCSSKSFLSISPFSMTGCHCVASTSFSEKYTVSQIRLWVSICITPNSLLHFHVVGVSFYGP